MHPGDIRSMNHKVFLVKVPTSIQKETIHELSPKSELRVQRPWLALEWEMLLQHENQVTIQEEPTYSRGLL